MVVVFFFFFFCYLIIRYNVDESRDLIDRSGSGTGNYTDNSILYI